MKTILSLIVLCMALTSLSSCGKESYTPPPPPFIVGSWTITGSAEQEMSDSAWNEIESGFNGGVFEFYENGAAHYTIGNNTLTGSWSMQDVRGGYYDDDGKYYDDEHHILSIYMSNYTRTEIIDMTLDVGEWSNPFVGSFSYDNYIYYFQFSKA